MTMYRRLWSSVKCHSIHEKGCPDPFAHFYTWIYQKEKQHHFCIVCRSDWCWNISYCFILLHFSIGVLYILYIQILIKTLAIHVILWGNHVIDNILCFLKKKKTMIFVCYTIVWISSCEEFEFTSSKMNLSWNDIVLTVWVIESVETIDHSVLYV